MRLTLQLRAVLREADDGIPEHELAQRVAKGVKVVLTALKAMPDAYIDRWDRHPTTNHWARVWAVVVPPPHCPPPVGKKGGFGAVPQN